MHNYLPHAKLAYCVETKR